MVVARGWPVMSPSLLANIPPEEENCEEEQGYEYESTQWYDAHIIYHKYLSRQGTIYNDSDSLTVCFSLRFLFINAKANLIAVNIPSNVISVSKIFISELYIARKTVRKIHNNLYMYCLYIHCVYK